MSVRPSTIKHNAATNQIVVFVRVDETFTMIWLSRSTEVRVKVTWYLNFQKWRFSKSISSAIFQPINETWYDVRGWWDIHVDMTFKVILGQGQGEEMTSVSIRTIYFLTGQVSLLCNKLLHTQLLYSLPLIINDISLLVSNACVPSVLWRCWLGGRKGIRPVKNWVVGCWRGCLGWGADLHIAQQMALPLTISCFSKSFLVPAHPGGPGHIPEEQ